MDELTRQKEILSALRVDLSRGLSAIRLLLEERTVQNEHLRKEHAEFRKQAEAALKELSDRIDRQLRALEEKQQEMYTAVAVLTERLKIQREGSQSYVTEKIKDYPKSDPVKHEVERWKATAPVIAAIVGGFFALISGLISLISHLVK